jgi:hypothetical protein
LKKNKFFSKLKKHNRGCGYFPTAFILPGKNKREAQDPKLGLPSKKIKKKSFVFCLNEISLETKEFFLFFSGRGGQDLGPMLHVYFL